MREANAPEALETFKAIVSESCEVSFIFSIQEALGIFPFRGGSNGSYLNDKIFELKINSSAFLIYL